MHYLLLSSISDKSKTQEAEESQATSKASSLLTERRPRIEKTIQHQSKQQISCTHGNGESGKSMESLENINK